VIVIGIDALLAPTVTPRLVNRFGNARVIFGGLLLAVLSYALFLPVGADWTYAAMFPSLIVLGLAFALAYGPPTIVATEGVEEEEQGLAGALLYTAFQFGAALGLSAVTAVNVAATDSGAPAELLDGYRAGLVVPLAAALLAAAVSAFGLRSRPGAIVAGSDAESRTDIAAARRSFPIRERSSRAQERSVPIQKSLYRCGKGLYRCGKGLYRCGKGMPFRFWSGHAHGPRDWIFRGPVPPSPPADTRAGAGMLVAGKAEKTVREVVLRCRWSAPRRDPGPHR
jgi:MFS family permease